MFYKKPFFYINMTSKTCLCIAINIQLDLFQYTLKSDSVSWSSH